MTVTIRVRSIAWFVSGIVITTAIAVMLANTWRADAAAGDTGSTFVPMTPCRLADTRQPGQGGPIGDGETRTFEAHGTNGDCFIPGDAVALSLNVTADRPTAPNTFLTIWRHNVPRPNASSLNPAQGEPPSPNAVTTNLAPAGRFDVYNDAGLVDVIIDVNGYYTTLSQRYAKVDADSGSATLIRGRGISSVRWVSTGTYQVDFDDPINSCGWIATRNSNFDAIAGPGEIAVELAAITDPDTLWVLTFNSSGALVDLPNSDGFTLHVIC